MATYLQTTVPLTKAVLKDLSCLQPNNRSVDTNKSAVSRLCLHMKKVTKANEFCDRVQAEWLLYMCDSSLDRLQPDFETSGNICAYWQEVSEVPDAMGGIYESLSYLAKAALTLSHSNAIPERGFSVSNALLDKGKLELAETTIVAERVVKDCSNLWVYH